MAPGLPRTLRLVLATPARLVVQEPEVVALRAEDASGSFGIRPGHADLVTALEPSVLFWRGPGGQKGLAAVSRGVLLVRDGREVLVACREAVKSGSLDALEREVARYHEAELEAERRATVARARLETRAIRQILRLLRPTGDRDYPRPGQRAPGAAG